MARETQSSSDAGLGTPKMTHSRANSIVVRTATVLALLAMAGHVISWAPWVRQFLGRAVDDCLYFVIPNVLLLLLLVLYWLLRKQLVPSDRIWLLNALLVSAVLAASIWVAILSSLPFYRMTIAH